MRLQTIAGGLFLVAAVAICAPAAEPKELVGTFTSKVTEPSGEKYEGTCEITHVSRRTVQLVWKYGKKISIGTGKLEGDVLTVEYEGAKADREGVATYQVKSANRMAGRFKRKGTKGVGTEVLVRKEAEPK